MVAERVLFIVMRCIRMCIITETCTTFSKTPHKIEKRIFNTNKQSIMTSFNVLRTRARTETGGGEETRRCAFVSHHARENEDETLSVSLVLENDTLPPFVPFSASSNRIIAG